MNAAVTPMMAQFLEIKAAHPDALLFYRMGDFYEMFFDDAVAAAAALDIALTKRGKHQGEDIPMCGVPVHSADGYLLSLIRKGFRVAVCEQMEDPAEAKKRGYKAVVRREVVRLVTPGTLTEDSLLDARRNNYLVAFCTVRDQGALASVDISTGELRVAPCPAVRLGPELARLAPREILISETLEAQFRDLIDEAGVALTPMAPSSFDSEASDARLRKLWNVKTLEAFGSFERPEIGAMGAIVDYLELTQKGNLPLLQAPIRENTGQIMQIDAATRRNLELMSSLSGEKSGSLLSVIERTLTPGGGRLLARHISSPSCDPDIIRDRLDAVTFFHDDRETADHLRDLLRKAPDMDRALSRLALDRAGPRDLASVRAGLAQAIDLHAALENRELPALVAEAHASLAGHEALVDQLDDALVAEPPLQLRDGGFIAPGFNTELDETRALRDEGRGVIAKLQGKYAELTDVATLKIKHNNVLGYFIEVTARYEERMLSPQLDGLFIRRQSTANAVRFTTVELSELETKILNAGSHAMEIEKRLYFALKETVLAESGRVFIAARALAAIDVSVAIADLARGENWCRPIIDTSRRFDVVGGRHPVVENALRQSSGQPFVANDCEISATDGQAHIRLLTGPNMAGKSTYLRQNALIAILAQAGCYVPAHSAHIGLVSSVFSRVGASDDLARGRSTFMVEMVETAAILNQANERSLVILDEIGRGTATYDGLSIAWATLEHLHAVNSCRALFATHYHELTSMASRLEGVQNSTVAVREWEGEVIFLHEVLDGAADRSYGVQVARLAGLPETVVERARVVLDALEKGEREGNVNSAAAVIDDLPLFAATPPAPTAPVARDSAVEEKLRALAPDEISARDALNILYDLKALAEKSSKA